MYFTIAFGIWRVVDDNIYDVLEFIAAGDGRFVEVER